MISEKRCLLALVGAIATSAVAAAGDQDWPLLGRNPDMQHNSPLQVINAGNVVNLVAVHVAAANGLRSQALDLNELVAGFRALDARVSADEACSSAGLDGEVASHRDAADVARCTPW